jgi:hypothetical protein
MRHHSPAVQQAGLGQQKRSDTHGADASTVKRTMLNPADQLAIATDLLDSAGARNDQRVDRVSIEGADRLRRDPHAVGGHDEATVYRVTEHS